MAQTHRDETLAGLRRLFERIDTQAQGSAVAFAWPKTQLAADAQVLRDAIHYLGCDEHLARTEALKRIADPTANALIEAMLPQLLLIFGRRLGGDITVPVDEIDATGGLVMELKVIGREAFRFIVRRKS